MISRITAIALNTFKEAVRNKVLYFLVIFALLLIVFSSFISDLSISSPEKLIADLGLSAMDFIGFLIAVFVGVYLVYNELDKKTIYTIVSKPVDRSHFIIGKFFGLLITIYVNIAIMAVCFFGVIYYRDATQYEVMQKVLSPEQADRTRKEPTAFAINSYYVKAAVKSAGKGVATLVGYSEPSTVGLMKTVAMSALGLAIITAFAIFYSTFSTPTLSAVFTSLTWLIGQLCEDIMRYADKLAQKAGSVEALMGPDKLKYWFAVASAHVVPNLSYFNLRTQAVYGNTLTNTAPMTEPPLLSYQVLAYGLLYTAGILTFACLIFRRRNFK